MAFRFSINSILPAIRDQLVAITGLDDSLVFIARPSQKVPYTMADWDIIIRPGGINPDSNFTTGTGRFDGRVRRNLEIHCRTRLSLDETHSDTAWLMDLTNGHLGHEETILDAIHIFWPMSESNEALLFEPMRFIGSSMPDKDQTDPAWGESMMNFEMAYVLNVDQSRQ